MKSNEKLDVCLYLYWMLMMILQRRLKECGVTCTCLPIHAIVKSAWERNLFKIKWWNIIANWWGNKGM